MKVIAKFISGYLLYQIVFPECMIGSGSRL